MASDDNDSPPPPQRYTGAETTGFMSPAQDYTEVTIDLGAVLDLRAPSRYPVRVVDSSPTLVRRGILAGDVLITDTTAKLEAGRVAVAFVQGDVVLATLERAASGWVLAIGGERRVPVADDAEVWAIAISLVRPVL